MNVDMLIDTLRSFLMLFALLLMPVFIPWIVVGIAVGIAQSVTQIQDGVIALFPKLLILGLVLAFMGRWYTEHFMSFFKDSLDHIVEIGQKL
jgi:flagellar biosynthesis protein FliQ